MRWLQQAGERPVSAVPKPVLWLLAGALLIQVALQAQRPPPSATAEQLGSPPAATVLRAIAGGEAIATAQLALLYLQAFDNQPGISIPFNDLDYGRVTSWLARALELDPAGQYPLMMASQLYGQVPDRNKQRLMCDFVHRQFLADPDRRWRWLAHCAIMARHRLNDPDLALRYAEDIARLAGRASSWARQMRIFFLADMGEVERATVLLGGLLAAGDVSDPREAHFLTERLQELKGAGNSSSTTKSRQPPASN